MDIIKHRYVFLSISGLVIAAAFLAVVLWGLNLGIDFRGGSLMEVEFPGERPSADEIRFLLRDLDLGNVSVQPTGEQGAILRFRHVNERFHQEALAALVGSGDAVVTEHRFETIGASIGEELKRRSLIALAVAIGVIVLYVAWSFRHVSKPVSSWKYGIVAVIALVHDVIIPTGVFAALGKFGQLEIDAFFISALLTILGFSVHDTIVVFDRIRENLSEKTEQSFSEVVARSIRQTFTRSLNTSLTSFIVLAAIFFFGGATLRFFSLALMIGVLVGTYSSLFLASPLLVIWHDWARLDKK